MNLREISDAGKVLEEKLTLFHEDLCLGIPAHKARGVKAYEADAWLRASEKALEVVFGSDSPQLAKWLQINKEYVECLKMNEEHEKSINYTSKLNKPDAGYIGNYLYFFRRRLSLISEQGLLQGSEPVELPQPLLLSVEKLIMRDSYDVNQAGAVGPHSRADNINFNNMWKDASNDVDLQVLANELNQLRNALKKESSENTDQDLIIGQIAAAEQSAIQSNGAKALEHLHNTGKWAFDVASKIGVSVAATALKKALDL